MHVHPYFLIVHQVLTHLIHMFTHPITHISPLSHSLGDKDDSHSYLASMAQARNQHQTQGEKKKGHLSLIKGSIDYRNVHIQEGSYMYRSIRGETWNHKITIIDGGHRLG